MKSRILRLAWVLWSKCLSWRCLQHMLWFIETDLLNFLSFCLHNLPSVCADIFGADCAECPLVFHEPSAVAKACDCTDMPSNVTCCTALNHYLLELQQQMLITNLQALHCVTILASILQNMSVSANIYSLCQIQLNDFSLQGRLSLLEYIYACIVTVAL
jgi:hypothetical protein